jgi:hypothetical protein
MNEEVPHNLMFTFDQEGDGRWNEIAKKHLIIVMRVRI